MANIIELKQVSKAYQQFGNSHQVLFDINLTITHGEFVVIMGASGNGKSTLLNLLTGIDQASNGEVLINGAALHKLSEEKLSVWRGGNVGIVFQFFQLLPTLNLLQNIILPMDFLGKIPKSQRKQQAMQLLELVGLSELALRLPSQISGGQQQRTAIARSLANDPPLIVADEPTGNLDTETAESVFRLFADLHQRGKTLLMVTHNPNLANAGSRTLEIHAGRIHTDTRHLPSH